MKKQFLGLLLAGVTLQGCASMSTMQSADMMVAPSQTFSAGNEQVLKATEKTITQNGLNLKQIERDGATTHVFFTKSMSAFSWGEVGRIDLLKVTDNSTKVSVASEKRYQLQLTGSDQDDFAAKIFEGIQQNL